MILKVNVKLAESNLKLAMEEVLKKEAEYKTLKERLTLRSSDIVRLRSGYARVSYALAFAVLAFMFGLCVLMFGSNASSAITQVSHFVWFAETLLLFYLIYPFHMAVAIGLGLVASVLFELLSLRRQIDSGADIVIDSSNDQSDDDQQLTSVYLQSQLIIFVFIKFLLHLSLHAIGLYLKVYIFF